MSTIPARVPVTALIAGAAFAAGGLLLAELTGVSELGDELQAGNERVDGVQITLVTWICLLAVPLAVAVAGHRDGTKGRMVAACAAAFGALAAFPLAAARSATVIEHDVRSAVVLGVLIGFVVALAVAAVPAVGWGITAHAALWWLTAVPAALIWTRVVAYAGLVEVLELDGLRRAVRPLLPADRVWGYHLPYMLPSVLTTVVLSGVVAAVVARRTSSWPKAFGAAVACPLLAVATYFATASAGDGLGLWNSDALVIAMLTAAAAIVVAAAAALVARFGTAARPRSGSRATR